MGWSEAKSGLTRRLEALMGHEGVGAPEVGRALRRLAEGLEVVGEVAHAPGGARAALELAWWLFARAPHLRADHALLSVMAVDLMTRDERGPLEVLEDLAALEEAVDGGLEASAALAALYAEHGIAPDDALALPDDALRGHLDAVLLATRTTLAADADALNKAALDGMLSSFDEAGRAGALLERRAVELSAERSADLVRQGNEAYERGDVDRALALFERAVERDPDDVDARVGRGVVLAAGAYLEEAVEDLSRALELAPGSAEARLNRALVLLAMGEGDRALADLDEAVSREPGRLDARINRSSARAQLGDHAGALADAQAAMESSPEAGAPWVQRAMLRRAAGDAVGAMSDYAEAIAREPGDADAWAGRGFLQLELGESEAAVDSFTRAIERDPSRGVLYYNRGNARAEAGDMAGAEEDFTEAIAADPGDVEARINRGTARLKREDLVGALEDWDAAIQLDPHHPGAYLRRGMVLAMSDEKAQAAEDLGRALELAPKGWPHEEFARAQLDSIVN
jgi:tetratricopeptide (TPR) repeat protein